MPAQQTQASAGRQPAPPGSRLLARTGAIAFGVALFAALATAVSYGWQPLLAVDAELVTVLHGLTADTPVALTALTFVTDLGGSEAARLLITLAVVWLLIRRLVRLALYAAATGLGAWVVSAGAKALVDRTRPEVEQPLAVVGDPSFPSGHAFGSAVTYGLLLLLFLPAVPRRWHTGAITATVALVAAVGVSRVALGVHYPSDVVAGWSLAFVWLSVTASAFRRWDTGTQEGPPLSEGAEPSARPRLVPAGHERVLPDGWRSVSVLIVSAVAIWGVLSGIGLLITGPLASSVGAWDEAVVQWFADHRAEGLTTVAVVVGAMGGTAGIVAVVVTASALAVALTRSWLPAVFLVLATVGETMLFVATATVVGRPRPPVVQLAQAIPPTDAFPSGHVAASVVTYGGIALLLGMWRGRAWGRPAVTAAVVVVGLVALSRLYRGMHYPTDVAASLVLGSLWLTACWRVIRPARARGTGPEEPG